MNDNKRKRCLSSTDNECSKSQRTIQTLRELIPPKHKKTSRSSAAAAIPPPRISPIPSDELLDWTAVITRVNSHPHEAAESYFRQSSSSSSDNDDTTPTYKPLHAMLKYNPPLSAVEAVLKAHPIAALDHTFEGTALKIAVESGVKSMPVLRLLLIAELAMSKKECSTATKDDDAATSSSSSLSQREDDGSTIIPTQSSSKDVYTGHNPIRWISESHIPRKTAALLLKWYPNGAFQRPSPQRQQQQHQDDDGDDDAITNSMLLYSDSPLIEIIDDFASDQDAVTEDDDDDDADDESEESDGDEILDNVFNDGEYSGLLPRRRRTFAEREHLRKERRWEKFLHILYATDKMLSSMKSLSSAEKDTNTASANASDNTAISGQTNIPNNVSTTESLSPVTTFHPVHAWIRCLTNPNLGLENCRPYGVWSILRAMGQRIPSEFTAKDRSDDDRTAFQTLAENPVSHCRLCTEEIRDIVECLLDADYRSAYLPRKSDGRLVIHVALENGWPCRDLFSRKLSATCA